MDYDPSLDRFDVAIRALYRLYHKQPGGRAELVTLGLTREQQETAFESYVYPKTQEQVFAIIRRVWSVVPAANTLLSRYVTVTAGSRFQFYTASERTSA